MGNIEYSGYYNSMSTSWVGGVVMHPTTQVPLCAWIWVSILFLTKNRLVSPVLYLFFLLEEIKLWQLAIAFVTFDCLNNDAKNPEFIIPFTQLLLLKQGGEQIYFGPLGRHSSEMIKYFEVNTT